MADTARYAALTNADSTRAKARVVSFTFQVKPAALAGLTAITFGSTPTETTALTAADLAAANVLTATDTGLIMITVTIDTSIVINEFLSNTGAGTGPNHDADGTRGDADEEFIEFFNTTGDSVNLGLWRIQDNTNPGCTLPIGLILGGQQFLNVYRGPAPDGSRWYRFSSDGTVILETGTYTGTFAALNAPDSVILRNASGTIVDSFSFLSETASRSIARFWDGATTWNMNARISPGLNLETQPQYNIPSPNAYFRLTATPQQFTQGETFTLTIEMLSRDTTVITLFDQTAQLTLETGALSKTTTGAFVAGICAESISITGLASSETIVITARFNTTTSGTVAVRVNVAPTATPNAPTPLAPADGAETGSPRPVFSWHHNDTDGYPQNRYHLQIADSSSFDNIIYQETVVAAETTIQITGSLPTGGVDTLYWRIRTASAPDSFSAFSSGDSFFVAKLRLPETPVLVAPANAHETSVKAIRFSWTHVDSDGSPQAGFNIQFSLNPDFSTLWRNDTGTTANEYYDTIFPSFSGDRTLYWRVRTTDLVGYGPFSETRSFVIMDTRPIIKIVQVGMRFTSAGGQDSDYVQFLVVDDRNDSNGVNLNGWKLFINATARETFGALTVRTGDLIVLSWTADATIPDSVTAGADSVAWTYTTNVGDGDGGIAHTTSRAIWLADSSADTRDAVVFTADGNFTVATSNAVNALVADFATLNWPLSLI